jgi:hypothetical protein
MVAMLPAAFLALAQAAQPAASAASTATASTQSSLPPPQTKTAESTAAPADGCPQPAGNSTTIVICTQRPQGYRLNPDVMEAKREMKNSSRPVRPNGVPRPDCATVGPAPCINAGIDLLAAVATAAEMAQRLGKGQEIGSMFVTDPQPDEYHRYLAAKARREADEAQQAALAKSKAAAAAQAVLAPAQPSGK